MLDMGGSPPLTRERRGVESVTDDKVGITPADAGKTAHVAATYQCK